PATRKRCLHSYEPTNLPSFSPVNTILTRSLVLHPNVPFARLTIATQTTYSPVPPYLQHSLPWIYGSTPLEQWSCCLPGRLPLAFPEAVDGESLSHMRPSGPTKTTTCHV